MNLLTLTSVSSAILYRCIVSGLNRTIEGAVNLNVTRIGFVFVLTSLVHMHAAVAVPEFVGERGAGSLKLNFQGHGVEKFGMQIEKYRKLDTFLGCHMCIVPYNVVHLKK